MTEAADDSAVHVSTQHHVNILLPDEITKISPSRRDNIDEDVEIRHRVFGCELIQHAGILLKCPQVVMVTAQNILHRFFYRKSLLRYDALSIAMGALLLASKIEEKSRILREVLMVFHRIYQRRRGFQCTPLELGGLEYNAWKE